MPEMIRLLFNEGEADGGGTGEGGGGEQGGGGTSVLGDPPQSGGGDQGGSWLDSLPDDLKGSESLKKFESVDQLAKSYVNLQGKVGGDTVKVPEDLTDPDQSKELRDKLGVPEQPDGYEMPTEGVPEGFEPDENTLESFKKEAQRVGLTKQQAAALYRWQAEQAQGVAQSQQKAVEQEVEQAQEELKKEWGSAYETRLKMANTVVERFGGDEVLEELKANGLGRSPKLVKALSEIGKRVLGDEVIGQGKGADFGVTPQDAQARINQKWADSEFTKAYYDRQHPNHEAAKNEMRQLQRIRAGEDQQ